MDKDELKKASRTEAQRLKAEYGLESDDDEAEFTPSEGDEDMIQAVGGHRKNKLSLNSLTSS